MTLSKKKKDTEKSDFTQIYCPNFVYFFFVLAQNIFSNFEVSLLLNFYIWNLNICAQKKHAISLDSGCAVGYYNVVASRHQLTLSYFCSITVSIVPTHSSQETHLDFASDFVIIGRDSPEFALRWFSFGRMDPRIFIYINLLTLAGSHWHQPWACSYKSRLTIASKMSTVRLLSPFTPLAFQSFQLHHPIPCHAYHSSSSPAHSSHLSPSPSRHLYPS